MTLRDTIKRKLMLPARFNPCWSCGAQGTECDLGCECAKCLDPEGYAEWKEENHEEYQEWLEEQEE
jgi:hypothetical protein